MEIIIDDREKSVIDFLPTITFPENIIYKIDRVTIGDYNVTYNGNIIFSIERKTWRDLSASIKDGRKENVNKMIDLRTKTQCRLFYIMEGKIPAINSRIANIPYKNLLSHLDHIMIRDNINILYSKDKRDTLLRIISLIQNFSTITPSLLPAVETESSNVSILKVTTKPTDECVIYKIWCCVPYITEKSASIFISKGYHISDLILGNISKDEIFTFKSDNYMIGKRSEKIWKFSRFNPDNSKIFIKMISQINGISKETAKLIYSSISFELLLKGDVTLEQLQEIKKSEKSKIGSKCANKILQFFKH